MPQELTEFFQQLFNGLMISGVYALVALGITVIFGLTGIVKFSVGELLTLGAFLTFAFWEGGATFFLAVPLAAIAVGGFALLLERGAFRFTLDQPINGFIVSLGLILVLQNVIIEVWTTDPRALQPPFTQVWEVGGVRMAVQRWFVVWVAVGLIAALFLVLRYTKYGRAMRACAEDRDAAALMGIPVALVIAGTFALGGALAATAGGLLASTSIGLIHPYMGATLLLKGFAVALVGGLGNIEGAVMAAILVGMTETMGAGYLATEWRDAYTFGLMILILLWRPTGLFPARGRLQETLQ
ncbi:MAG: branched-chain amino acid ABC transporter permease [Chloroflexi bacterium]|nr:branched-chain amino acid ABC transporter permease [Chloroflexota bacterium]